MSKTVFSYLIHSFGDFSCVDQDVLRVASFYIEKAQELPATGADDELLKELDAEIFDEHSLGILKERLVSFASWTSNTDHLVSAISVIGQFNDGKLSALLIGWLNTHLRALIGHNSVVFQLLIALQRMDESVPHRMTQGESTIESNVEVAKEFLEGKLGITYF